jgi:hypothetical protein
LTPVRRVQELATYCQTKDFREYRRNGVANLPMCATPVSAERIRIGERLQSGELARG